ncbi:hypothetical protein [Brachybacterium sillae]|nr:hypothetical protein [Brachybacterium sillae]
MDPIRNPYTPNAGERPDVLAGRDDQLATFDVAHSAWPAADPRVP